MQLSDVSYMHQSSPGREDGVGNTAIWHLSVVSNEVEIEIET